MTIHKGELEQQKQQHHHWLPQEPHHVAAQPTEVGYTGVYLQIWQQGVSAFTSSPRQWKCTLNAQALLLPDRKKTILLFHVHNLQLWTWNNQVWSAFGVPHHSFLCLHGAYCQDLNIMLNNSVTFTGYPIYLIFLPPPNVEGHKCQVWRSWTNYRDGQVILLMKSQMGSWVECT